MGLSVIHIAFVIVPQTKVTRLKVRWAWRPFEEIPFSWSIGQETLINLAKWEAALRSAWSCSWSSWCWPPPAPDVSAQASLCASEFLWSVSVVSPRLGFWHHCDKQDPTHRALQVTKFLFTGVFTKQSVCATFQLPILAQHTPHSSFVRSRCPTQMRKGDDVCQLWQSASPDTTPLTHSSTPSLELSHKPHPATVK